MSSPVAESPVSVVQGYSPGNLRAAFGCGPGAEFPTQFGCPVLEIGQAAAASVGHQTNAVIADRRGHMRLVDRHDDIDASGRRVPSGVRQRLSDDGEQALGNACGDPGINQALQA